MAHFDWGLVSAVNDSDTEHPEPAPTGHDRPTSMDVEPHRRNSIGVWLVLIS